MINFLCGECSEFNAFRILRNTSIITIMIKLPNGFEKFRTTVLSYLFIKVFIPHVIDGATGTSHKQSSNTEQSQHAKVREASGVCGQPNTPCTGQIQQPSSYKSTMLIFYLVVSLTKAFHVISPIGLSSLINRR